MWSMRAGLAALLFLPASSWVLKKQTSLSGAVQHCMHATPVQSKFAGLMAGDTLCPNAPSSSWPAVRFICENDGSLVATLPDDPCPKTFALRINGIGREELSSSTEPLNMFHVEYGDMTRRFPHAPVLPWAQETTHAPDLVVADALLVRA
jgi:hypothetical protein